MIISHKYKFIFIKTQKTAGTSIEVFLSQHCGPEDVLTPIYPPVEPHVARNHTGFWNPAREISQVKEQGFFRAIRHVLKRRRFYNHIPARLAKCRMPDAIWNGYFKFCLERNPWDKTLSHYHMVKDRSGRNLSLDEYLDRGNFSLNYPIYADENDKILVDEVVKYESMSAGLQQIFDRLGIPFNGSLGVKAKSEHRKDRRPYQEVFNRDQRARVEQAFAKEIKMHGYTF